MFVGWGKGVGLFDNCYVNIFNNFVEVVVVWEDIEVWDCFQFVQCIVGMVEVVVGDYWYVIIVGGYYWFQYQ